MSWSEDDELRSGSSNSEEYDLMFGSHGEHGISQAQASKIADAILADPHTAPPSDGPKVGPRRNRHLDGFGGRNNA
jgi:hypothetical protein